MIVKVKKMIIEYPILAKKGMVNLHSSPTADTHRIIAKMMEPYFE